MNEPREEYDAATAYLRLLVCEGEERAEAVCGCTLTLEDDGDVALHQCDPHEQAVKGKDSTGCTQ